MTFEEFLKRQYVGYQRLSNEFDHYSPKYELYQGYAGMCKRLLESDYKSLLMLEADFPYDNTPSSWYGNCRTCATRSCESWKSRPRESNNYVCCASYTSESY